MTHNDPLWPTVTQYIHIMTHYDPKPGKLFYNDPKQSTRTFYFPKLPKVWAIWYRNLKVLCLKFNSIQRGIQSCWFWVLAIFFLNVFYWTNLASKRQNTFLEWKSIQWAFGSKLSDKRVFQGRSLKNYSWTQTQQPWIPLFIEFHFKQSTLKFRDQICPQKKNFKTKLKKAIVESTPVNTALYESSF